MSDVELRGTHTRWLAFCVECERFHTKTDLLASGNSAFGGGLNGELGGGSYARALELADLHNRGTRETHRVVIARELDIDDYQRVLRRLPPAQRRAQCFAQRLGQDLYGRPMREYCARPQGHGGPHDILVAPPGPCSYCGGPVPASLVCERAGAAIQRAVCPTCLPRVDTGYEPEPPEPEYT